MTSLRGEFQTMSHLLDFRREKDHYFAHNPHSPLLPEQRQDFQGLRYYEENPALCFEVTIEPYTGGEHRTIPMQTSTGSVVDYERYGRFTFQVDGQEVALTVYMSAGNGGFFVPFMDATSGEETYSGGRYLELEPLPGGRYLVDFNMAYNPYCAYNELWTCPIPPKENRLSVPIRAGEKNFTGVWAEGRH